MDAERFDRWAKFFAQRISRRTAVGALGALSVAALAPRAAMAETCEPVTRCKKKDGVCTDVGPLPGGPYPQRWVWTPIPGCTVDGPDRLDLICNNSFSECAPWGCVPGIDGWAIGCR
jgi:hypothetical protein